MAKIALFPALLGAACLTAGAYGAPHNQISYSVSPEYSHDFKFDQFGISEGLRGRIGAAIVGWRASWWMGFLVGMPVLAVGLVLPDWKTYLRCCLMAFLVVTATTLAVGLGALLYANLTITEETVPWYLDHVANKVRPCRSHA